jgi:hypothetical protein
MNSPKVGSKVSVSLRFSQGAAMIPAESTTRTYTGTVLPSYKWMNDRQFCLSGDTDWPVRVINLDSLEALTLESGELVKVDTSTKQFIVDGSKGSKYVVQREKTGWSCTCTGFGFRKSCKHITEISNRELNENSISK